MEVGLDTRAGWGSWGYRSRPGVGQVWAWGCGSPSGTGVGQEPGHMKGDPVAGLAGSLGLRESTWGLASLEWAGSLGPWELAGTEVAWEPGALGVTWGWCVPDSGGKLVLTSSLVPMGRVSLLWAVRAWERCDRVTWTVFLTVLNASLISVLHPGTIIPYLESLALGKLFLCVDSCSNCYFWEGTSTGNSCTIILLTSLLKSLFNLFFDPLVIENCFNFQVFGTFPDIFQLSISSLVSLW